MELRHEVRRRVFRFQRADGTLISLVTQLLPNGGMTSLAHENEAAWAIEAGELVFLARDGAVTTRFSETAEAAGRIVLRGRLLAGDGDVVHELHGARGYDPRVRARESFHARVELGRGAPALVVVLNGRGFTYDGEDTRRTFFEMAGLAPAVGADAAHVAEREDRCAWYADKADRVAAMLVGVVAGTGSGRVLLAGTSAGGFGAMLVGELLGRRQPDLDIRTITLNPQTSLRPEVTEALADGVAPHWLAPSIAPDALAACRAEWLHLPELIRARPGAGPLHDVLFDSANPAEAHHAGLLARVPRCRLLPRPLGVPHMEGPGLLYASGDVHALARAFVDG